MPQSYEFKVMVHLPGLVALDFRLIAMLMETDGGIRTFLKNSGAQLKIPDCVRLRADGTNEVAGITPDVIIPWRPNDNRYQRVKRVLDTLSLNR